jgi:5-methylcytosine-specific restriction endonuclease McrA
MSRAEFSKQTKRDAMHRSGKRCEATLNGERCNAPLDRGVEFDHVDADYFSKDNSLENCAAICVTCHKAKTRSDVKLIAKSKRIQDRELGIKPKPSRPMPGSRASGWKKPFNRPAERRA